MDHQVLPTLFLLHESIGRDRLFDMILTARNRLKPIQKNVLGKYKQEQAAYEEWVAQLNKVGEDKVAM